MKRRSFLQSIIGGVAALFVRSEPKPLAKSITYAKTTETKGKAVPVVWRNWAVLEKEPEAYTKEDIDKLVKHLAENINHTMDELVLVIIKS